MAPRPAQSDPAVLGADRLVDWLTRPMSPGEPETPLAERIERLVLGGPRQFTRVDIERITGVARARSERLWRALGFAHVADDQVVFTAADVEAAELLDRLVDSGLIETGMEAAVARAAGQSLARLAEWEIGLISGYVVALLEEQPRQLDDAAVIAVAEYLLPTIEQLHSYVWRRHVSAITGRALAGPSEAVVVVGFADVVGYTRRSRSLSHGELSELLERFESTAAELVADHGGRVVKSLGDEVLFMADDPLAAAEIGLGLQEPCHPELPDLRVGMARGSVLSRFGDVYGPVVNLANRLTSAARPGAVLVDRELAVALSGQPGLHLRRRRPIVVRGYTNLASWRLTRVATP